MKIIDLTPYRCPYPLVQVKLLLKKMKIGDNVVVYLSDSGSRQDVPVFVKNMGFTVVVTENTATQLALIISK
ncbi:sulfurtransferase TusA family protein [Shewanella intestini]|uniref:Sulfurtransferase TusA family protein n=1 Tax=Shewanella intestini TaxID=2017544 RepID=A0ABS5HZ95_9GAMM|nr:MULTISPECIES: sulfurtransferase TusA family protein [Shewanella]MBR9727112.1 sulfurtransferase TusA family protein [Shewanella intestini]MRG35914.1 response regulator SirA [Shewanella sp. XMDDZSB0408]